MTRRGILLIEVIAACGLTAVLLALCVQMLSLTALERRHIERRAIALQEAANLLERASALPFDELSDAKLAELTITPEVREILPQAKSAFIVSDEPGDLPTRRVRLEIHWQGRGTRKEAPARLTFWAFAPQPAAEDLSSDPAEVESNPNDESPDPPPTNESPAEDAALEAAATGVEP